MIVIKYLKQYTTAFKWHLIVCFCAACTGLNAQDEIIDSLKFEIKTAKHDTTLCLALTELGEYIFNQTPDSALILWQKVERISGENLKKSSLKKSHATFSFLLARTYQNYGYYHQTYSGPDEGLKYFKKALILNTERGDKENIANCLVDIGQIYFRQGNVLQALENYHQALKFFEKFKSIDNMAFCLGSIGNLYAAQDDLGNALSYLNRSASLYEKNKNNTGLAFSLNGIASIYSKKSDPESQEKALKGYLKVLDLWTSENNQSGIASVCLYIASLYRSQGDLTNAFKYANRSLNLNESLKAKPGISASTNILANIMFDKGNIRSAEEFANKSMKVAKELGYPKILMSVSATLKKIYEKQNNYKGALEMNELSVKMRDSLNNETTRKTTIKKQFELEYERQAEKDSLVNALNIKEERIKHEQAIAHQRLYTYGGALGFMLMLVIAVVSFKAYKTKQKANKTITKQSNTIENANKDLERQHLLNQKIFSVISHDFRGPILSLNLVLNKFKNNSDDEKLNKYLKDIGTSVHNANTVLNNLLSWAKAEINFGSYEELNCAVADVATKVETEFIEKLGDKKIELIQQIPKGAQVCIPSDILIIALRNLVSNAIKFSDLEGKIEIACDAAHSIITVKDNGCGISTEKLNLLFKQQVNSDAGTQKEQGFGMGLYIVAELLHKYNYAIKADSELNEGTLFTIFPKK